jgi:16S rRNA (guanine966-N2)-methyltransferase
MDMVKNAIFNVLGESIEGINVLDLFAGIGGLGIEALSRGATRCVFVEKDRRACDTIRQNLAKTRVTGGEVANAEVDAWLKRLAGEAAFHLVLADPPYVKEPGDRDFAAELVASAELRRALKPGGLFVLEHMPGVPLDPGPAWECVRRKRYGATEVSFLRPRAE